VYRGYQRSGLSISKKGSLVDEPELNEYFGGRPHLPFRLHPTLHGLFCQFLSLLADVEIEEYQVVSGKTEEKGNVEESERRLVLQGGNAERGPKLSSCAKGNENSV